MNPDDLDALIERLQADVSSSVLETMLQEATAGDITASGGHLSETDGGYMSHTYYGWLLAREHDSKTYLLIEDRGENLHAIECGTQPDVEFWSRLLGMRSEGADSDPEEPDDAHEGGGEDVDEEDERERTTLPRDYVSWYVSSPARLVLQIPVIHEEEHPS